MIKKNKFFGIKKLNQFDEKIPNTLTVTVTTKEESFTNEPPRTFLLHDQGLDEINDNLQGRRKL